METEDCEEKQEEKDEKDEKEGAEEEQEEEEERHTDGILGQEERRRYEGGNWRGMGRNRRMRRRRKEG